MQHAPLIDELPRTDSPPPDDDPMPLPSNPVTMLLAGILGLLAIYALWVTAEIAIPVVMAFMLYLVLQPVMRFLERRRLPRPLAAVVVLLALCGGVAALTILLVNPVSAWAARLPATLDRVEERFSDVTRIVRQVQRAGRQVEAKIAPDSPVTPVTVQGPTLSTQLLTGTRELIVSLVTIIMLLFFLLLSGDVFLRRLVEVLPTLTNKKRAVEITSEIRTGVSAYLLTITAMNAAAGVATGLSAWACGLPDPVLSGSVAFFCNYIPFLGPLLCGGLLLMVGIATFDDAWLAVLPALLYFAIHLLEGQFITPLLLARRLILNPVIVIVSIVFWYWMWGIAGAVLAVPMLATIKIVCDRVRGLAAFGHFLAAEPRATA
jgi:predicted PurR-regulated permease PerM